MANIELGRMERVDLRKIWESEAGDFTPWLARPENLKLLADTIEIDLELDSTEKSVGPFRADILCRDTSNDHWVLIENQIEKTDHTHLGQIITYASGLQAVTIVWISRSFTEEHRAALDWLNEHTDESINFFGLEIELWSIGGSSVAPKFNIISKPNDWARTVQAAAGKGEVSDNKLSQLRFWTAYAEYMEGRKGSIRCTKPLPQHWMNHAIGRTGAHLTSIISSWSSLSGTSGPEIRAEVILDGPTSKEEYADLFAQKEAIEKRLGFSLTWHNPEDKKVCRIYDRLDIDFKDEAHMKECFEWLESKLEKLYAVFAPLLKKKG